ncbi:hypothetical protein HN695_00590 [Candidatus Woesearchaeota archaeon]|jgi:hypothetical protein|nr:hypothetical protein [Candidatus Woesearchaeota archaeon]MBT5272830.1 hypothetical protein [Candidatus Woesearchaeota archaeon]MBT6040442.1 hypothetical protein [Candidatus Woesearchaeota archaeon]MBT6336925.1 hypothetical protein [Candidatus Woesearchaeota archaeon]MBT7926811.1 hypothetical protein [Candidatus Woesearchaeota archaeon]
MCSCKKFCGLLVLLVGVLFLLQDLAIWNFWNLNWYTVAFLLLGFAHLGKAHCKECCTTEKPKKKKKRK